MARGQLSTAIGRRLIEQFFAAYLKSELRGPPKIVHAEGHSFSDVAAKCLHIVNLASVRDLERTLSASGQSAALSRQSLSGWPGTLGGVRLAQQADRRGAGAACRLFARTQRCEATNVDPATGARDLAIPAHLLRTWGHTEFGIYARVVEGGELTPGLGRGESTPKARNLPAAPAIAYSREGSSFALPLAVLSGASSSLRASRTGRRKNSGCSCVCCGWKRSRRRGGGDVGLLRCPGVGRGLGALQVGLLRAVCRTLAVRRAHDRCGDHDPCCGRDPGSAHDRAGRVARWRLLSAAAMLARLRV